MQSYTQSIIAMLAVVNPFICAVMLLQADTDGDKKHNIVEGLKAMGIVLAILLGAALGGKYILHGFGITLTTFKIVGGIILGFIGTQMMIGSSTANFSDASQSHRTRVIMFAASPASIAMVVTLGTVQPHQEIPLNAVVGTMVAVATAALAIVVTQALWADKKVKQSNIGSRFMGMIIAAMGLQFALDGIKAFFL